MTRDDVKITEVCCRPILKAEPERETSKLSEYEALQLEHRRALEALRQFAEGVRIVTRQMKQQQQQQQQHADDNDDSVASTSASEGTLSIRDRTYSADSALSSSVVSEDDRRLNDLSHSPLLCDDDLAADLMGLSQAAQMVSEHARLAGIEASIATDDFTRAGRAAHEACERAAKAEKAAKMLHRENKKLVKQLECLVTERRVLAKEVKFLRKENAFLKQRQQEYQRQEALLVLEHHVRGALEMHEQQLAIANRITVATAGEPAAAEGSGAETETAATDAAETPEPQNEECVVDVGVNHEDESGEGEFVDVDEADAKPTNPESKKAKKAGFGAASGLAGYGQKLNKKMKDLQVSTKRQVAPCPQISIEAPNASTVSTQESTPPRRRVGADEDSDDDLKHTNKENYLEKQPRKPVGRNFLGELSTATSNFTSFFALSGPAMVEVARERTSLSVDIPPSVSMMQKPILMSPYSEEKSPVGVAEATSKRLMDAPCNDQVLRSLSIPQDLSRDSDDPLL